MREIREMENSQFLYSIFLDYKKMFFNKELGG